MKTPSYLPKLVCLALALAWTHGSQAATVYWGSLFNDNLYDSNGNALDATYSFEIGTFGDASTNFVPTYANVADWQANWHVLDRAFAPDANHWDPIQQTFGGPFDVVGGTSDSAYANPTDVFTQGFVAYLWAFNSKDILPGTEWALITDGSSVGDAVPSDDWIIPDPTDTNSYNWNLADASSAIVGGANGIQGAGTYSSSPAIFSLQTAVVPEPGSAFLLLAAAAAHLTRRARRLTRMSSPL